MDLIKRYRTVTALDGLSMVVERGEIFGFLGPNGAGKTTAVKLLLGLTRPTAGEAWVLGHRAGELAAKRRTGYLPELFRYQDWLSAREVLALHCNLARVPRDAAAGRIAGTLDLVGLGERGRDRVGTFSKGTQQRLGLAVALVGNPDLVFLDEPTSALDPVGRHDVREIIRSLRARGTTVFLNSHLLSEVEQVCDRVAVINKGRLLAMGSMDDLRGRVGSLRLRLGGVTPAVLDLLHAAGSVDVGEEAYEVTGVTPDAVPDLVARLVAAGCRVYAVEPHTRSLEERFLELLGENDADPDDRAPDPA